MHHQVGVGQVLVDFFDAVNAQHIACGLAGEFISAVAGADGDGQRIHAGVFHEAGGIFHAGEHLVVRELAHGAHAIFFAGFAGFEVAQHADFAFYRHAAGVGELHHFAGDFCVVFIGSGRFAVGQKRAVHHHRAEAQLNRALAHIGRSAVVLVHHHGNMRKFFNGGQNQVAQKRGAGIFARAGAGLHDNGRVHLVGGFHNGAHLFEIIDIKRRQAVAVFRRMVQQLAHGYKCHEKLLGFVV